MGRVDLNKELERARQLCSTLGKKPFLPQISIEVRRSLAEVLSTDESVDHLIKVARLNRPIVEEIPLWEDDSELAEWLDTMEAEDREEEVLRIQYQEECENRLREAQKNFELFLAGCETVPADSNETKVARRTMSTDDLHDGVASNAGNELRRRPSFMADTSQGHIQVDAIGTPCSQQANLPVTSTPHVPAANRRPAPRVSAVAPAADLFNAGAAEESSRPRKQSFTRIEYVRSKTFERKADGNEGEIRNPQSTFVASKEDEPQEASGTTICKKSNTTIVKSSSNAEETQIVKRTGNVPRIACSQKQPTIAPKTTARETKLQKPGKFTSKIQVLPSKVSSGVPARQLPPRKPVAASREPSSVSSASSTSSSSRPASTITRPSKPARLPARK